MARHMAEQAQRQGTRTAVLVGCLVLVALAVAAGWYLFLRPAGPQAPVDAATNSTGQTPASDAAVAPEQQPAATTPFAQLLANGELTSIRLVGDSITAGYGTDGYENPDSLRESAVIYDDGAGTVHYETGVSANSWANAFRGWAAEHGVASFVNAGINGAFMHQLAENPDAWMGSGADVIVVALGTNDAGYYGPQEYAADAEAALAAAAERSKLVVAVAPVNDLRSPDTLVVPAAQFGDILAGICDRDGYLFVDPRAAVTTDMFASDGLHPTSQGSLAIWQCLRDALGI